MYEIIEVQTEQDLKEWVHFGFEHYKNHPYQVPQIKKDELEYFKETNPAYKISSVKKFVVKDENKNIVGRICGIIHHLETEKLGKKRGRMGWFESINDQEVANLLFDSLKKWFIEEGCEEMTGPHGFTDLDVEGLLIEGFNFYPTISGPYNYPYYQKLFENYGLQKEIDYHEHRARIPEEYKLFEKMKKKISTQSEFSYIELKSRSDIKAKSSQIWEVLEKSFSDLYGVTPLTSEQNDYYTEKYFSFLDPRYIVLVENNETKKLVGFFIGMPNLSKGFKKANGNLLPLGILHILKNFKFPDTIDFLLAGVDPEENNSKLIFSMLVVKMYETLKKNGIKYLETNRELESNSAVLGIWSRFENIYFRKSRIYKAELSS